MTVPTTNYQNSSIADGVAKFFPFDFALLQESDLDVYADGVVQTSNYIVLMNDNGIGGTVIFDVAPDAGKTILRQRLVDYTQQVALPTEGNLPEKVLEHMVDKCTMQVQQLKLVLDSGGSGGTGNVVGPPSAFDNHLAVFDGVTGKLIKDGGPIPAGGGGGTGDVVGPASATDNSVALFSGATGKLLKDGIALGSSGQVLTSGGAGVAPSFQALPAGGTGDVVGPASSVDSGLVAFNGTTGKLIKAAGTVPLAAGGTNNASYAATNWSFAVGDGTKIIDSPVLAAGQSIRRNAAGTAYEAFTPGAGGSGDVVGPASSVDSTLALFNGTTGKLIKQGPSLPASGAIGDVVGPASSSVDGRIAQFSGTTGKLLKDGLTGTSGYALISAGAGAPAFGILGLSAGGTNNGGYTAANWSFAVGDGSKIVDSPAVAASQSVRRNSAGTAWEAFTPSAASSGPNFTSADQTISAAGALTIPHGLGVAPTNVWCSFVCQTAEGNYSVNDVVFQSNMFDNLGSKGVSFTVDATNINVRFGSASSPIQLLNKTTGAGFAATNASWKMRVYANK